MGQSKLDTTVSMYKDHVHVIVLGRPQTPPCFLNNGEESIIVLQSHVYTHMTILQPSCH